MRNPLFQSPSIASAATMNCQQSTISDLFLWPTIFHVPGIAPSVQPVGVAAAHLDAHGHSSDSDDMSLGADTADKTSWSDDAVNASSSEEAFEEEVFEEGDDDSDEEDMPAPPGLQGILGSGPAQCRGDGRPAGRFPLYPNGRCAHREHWKHLRAKRNHSYFTCSLCGLDWRQQRPNIGRRLGARTNRPSKGQKAGGPAPPKGQKAGGPAPPLPHPRCAFPASVAGNSSWKPPAKRGMNAY